MSKHIIAIVDDLFFASKIRGTAEQIGVSASFPRTTDAVAEMAARDKPSLILCDLHAQKIDPIELARKLKADEGTRDIPLLGFFSHVDADLRRRAVVARFDRLVPNSLLTETIAEILMS